MRAVRETDTQTDRQTDRETDTERQTQRDTDTERHRQTDRDGNREREYTSIEKIVFIHHSFFPAEKQHLADSRLSVVRTAAITPCVHFTLPMGIR